MRTAFIKKALVSGTAAATIAGFASSAAFAWDGSYGSYNNDYNSYHHHSCPMIRYENNYGNDWNWDGDYSSNGYWNGCHHMMYSSYNENNYRNHDFNYGNGCDHYDGYHDNSY